MAHGRIEKGFKAGIITLILLPSVLLFMVSSAYAQGFYTDFFVTLKDINSEELVSSMPVNLMWTKLETGTTINLTKYIDKRGTFSYRISPGKWKLQVYVDNTSTPEIDYFGESSYSLTDELVTRGEMMYVMPVGAFEIVVSDSSGSIITGADIGFKCKSYQSIAKTDRFGSYKAENVPVGECKVSAAYGNLMGSAGINVRQGNVVTEEIALTENIKSSFKDSFKEYAYYVLGAIIIIILLVVSYIIIKKKVKKEVRDEIAKKVKKHISMRAKPAAEEETKKTVKAEAKKQDERPGEKEALNPRARDVMKTLNEKEQRVITFLIQGNNKSTQASIRNETGIPKTTLVRLFQALEAKKVIKVETIGKLKKIELTDWFLGKE